MDKEKYIIDRIEDGVLVLVKSVGENELTVNSADYPGDFSQNDIVFVFTENGIIQKIVADKIRSANNKNRIKRKIKLLFDNK